MTTISRRGVLAAGAGATALLAAPTVFAQNARQSLSFVFAPDETGAIQALIDSFNAAQSDVEVVYRTAPEQTDEFFRVAVSDLEAGSSDMDMLGADVIWTAELADLELIEDLSARIHTELSPADILVASFNSAVFRNRLWAVPWFTDAGMLFYRRDLLEAAGVAPPNTWDELEAAVAAVKAENDIPHGFVFQGGDYEGGVTNALEFIWSAGGRTMTAQSQVSGAIGMRSMRDANVISLNSRNAVLGLEKARELVANGIAPEDVATFNERDALRVFSAGEAVFMRNWPFAYGLLGSDEYQGLSQDQVGVARIPTLRDGARSYSCLGGWNLAVSRAAPNKDAAWAFIRHALNADQQRGMARQGGFLPVLAELYGDEALAAEVPVIAKGAEAIQSARSRPSSAIYSRLSPRIASMFNRVLTGEVEPQEAVRETENELRRIVRRARS